MIIQIISVLSYFHLCLHFILSSHYYVLYLSLDLFISSLCFLLYIHSLLGSESTYLFCQPHVSFLLFRFTPSLMSHVLRLPIGAFGFSHPCYLAASSSRSFPAPVYIILLIILFLINTNRCTFSY